MNTIEDTLQNLMAEANSADQEISQGEQQDSQNFWNEFGSMIGELKNTVEGAKAEAHDGVPLELNKVPTSKATVSLDIHPHVETYKVWVNWTTQRREQPGLHNDFFEIHSPWGTFTAIEELKVLLAQKFPYEKWAVLSVFPVQ